MFILNTTDGRFVGREIDETLKIINLDGYLFEVVLAQKLGSLLILSNPNYIIYLKDK